MKQEYIESFLDNLGFIKNKNEYLIKINNYLINVCIVFGKSGIEYSNIDYGNKIVVEHGGITNLSKEESLVQLECVIRLLKKGYLPESIELEKTYRLGHKDKGRLDILVKKDNVAWCLIECKTYGEKFNKEIKKVLHNGSQVFSYYAQDRMPMLIGVYCSELINNKIEYEFYQISTKNMDKVGSVADIYKSWDKKYVENGIFSSELSAYEIDEFNIRKKDLKELNKEIGNKLYNNFLEILRRHAISDKSNAFNIFFNLFVCKIYDEEMKSNDNEIMELQWKNNDTIDLLLDRISKLYYCAIGEYLSLHYDKSFCTKLGNDTVFPIREFSFIEILNKNDYIKNASILIEVVKILQEYKIKYYTRQQFLGDFFENLLNKGFKQESGQFFTPIPLTRFILKSLPLDKIIQEKVKNKEQYILPYVIDYACGSGHFLTEAMLEIENKFNCIKEENLTGPQKNAFCASKHNYYWAKEYLYGIEKDSRLAKIAKIAMFLNGDGDADIVSYDGLADFYKNNVYKNKLKSLSENKSLNTFDIVVSNPPFSVDGFYNTIDNLENFCLRNCLTEKSQEIECFFFERTIQLLKDNGYAGLIFPLSLLNNSNNIYTRTRELLIMNFEIYNLTEFREKVFSATNTSVVVLFIRKRNTEELLSIVEEYCTKNNITENAEINDIKKSIKLNRYIENGLNGKISKYIIKNTRQKEVLVAFSGEKKTQEYFQGYRTNKGELIEKNYGLLTSKDGKYTNSDLASVIHGEFINKKIDFSDTELRKYAVKIPFSDLFIDNEQKFFINSPSKFLTHKTIKIESICPYGDVIENYELKPISLSELEKDKKIKLISGLTYAKDEEVPYKTNNTVLTASNIDIKTGRLTFETKLVYLNENYKIDNEVQVRKNDIIISMSSGSLKHLGKVALIDENRSDMVGGFLHIIRCEDEKLSFALYNRLMSKKFREYVFSKKGQNINNLNMTELSKMTILLPKDIDKFYKNEKKK